MNKKLICLASSFLACILAACSSTSTAKDFRLVPNIKFYYSQDNGKSYGDSRRQLLVGTTAYMKIMLAIAENIDKTMVVNVDIKIPNIKGIEATYNRGQNIPSKDDAVNNCVIYTASIVPALSPDTTEMVFKFVPLSEGDVSMSVTYDDNVLALYDYLETVSFVKTISTTTSSSSSTSASTSQSESESSGTSSVSA